MTVKLPSGPCSSSMDTTSTKLGSTPSTVEVTFTYSTERTAQSNIMEANQENGSLWRPAEARRRVRHRER